MQNINDKDKWKTFPCKTCLVKKTCKQDCFEYPDIEGGLSRYIKENQLEGICLNCGDASVSSHDRWCGICYTRRFWRMGD